MKAYTRLTNKVNEIQETQAGLRALINDTKNPLNMVVNGMIATRNALDTMYRSTLKTSDEALRVANIEGDREGFKNIVALRVKIEDALRINNTNLNTLVQS